MPADQDVAAAGAGVTQDANGNPTTTALPWAEVAFLYDANILGLGKDYAFPEGSNASSSRWDQITTLAKVLTRTHTHADGNTYDIWDAVQTILKWVLAQDPTINSNETDSVNYVAPKPATS
jgi:hypothetical protein